jgi:hypothetical protein
VNAPWVAIFDTMSTPGNDLRQAVEEAVPRLRAMDEAAASTPRAHGKWSPKEVMGHLIDSATNNHGRFIRAQLQESMRFEGYAQDDWVNVQRYSEDDWDTLIDLWQALNLHLARVMDRSSTAARMRPRNEHNLDAVSFNAPSTDAPMTLDRFMTDYVEHLKHHLRQVLA